MKEDGTIEDQYRTDYLLQCIAAMKDAIELDGVELKGDTPWVCIDIVSAGTGEMKKRYGLIHVDMDDFGKGASNSRKKNRFIGIKT